MDEIQPASADSDAFLDRLNACSQLALLAEMASGMAHELSQPLAALATYSHAGARMLDRTDPMVGKALEVFRQMSDEALKSGTRLQTLRRMFDQERVEPVRCQMRDLVVEMQPALAAVTGPARACVSLDALTEVPDVYVERLKIQYIVLALIRNAVEASAALIGERPIQITISADRHTVETGICDQGAGIAPDFKEHLFRPFFTTKSHGCGLGLASSRAIVESHEGTIGYSNLPAGGCRFWFRLPIKSD